MIASKRTRFMPLVRSVPEMLRLANVARQCPLWVISRHFAVQSPCPLYPRKRTCAVQLGMSALCHIADMCGAKRHVRFTPESDIKYGIWNARLGRARILSNKRGSARQITVISVNLPGCVSTSIEPPCCLTMMSWLMESPRPVPSPDGLVVKNGLNIFSFTSDVIPVPLSRILISTRSPRSLVEAVRVGS